MWHRATHTQNCNKKWLEHILHEERDVKFPFKGNIISRIKKPVELSNNWVLKNFKYQKPEFYARFFDE